jgi:hypothetical protein
MKKKEIKPSRLRIDFKFNPEDRREGSPEYNLGYIDIIIDNTPIFPFSREKLMGTEYDPDKLTQDEMTKAHSYPLRFLKWLNIYLQDHLNSHNAPVGNYESGIDVFKKYVHECVFPENMYPSDRPKSYFPVTLHTGLSKVVIQATNDLDLFEMWKSTHIPNQSVPYFPQSLCIQSWPHHPDLVELSWSFDARYREHSEGQYFILKNRYKEEVFRASIDGLIQLQGIYPEHKSEIQEVIDSYK